MKICSKCKCEKPLDDFYNQNDRKSGKASQCKECFNKMCTQRWINRKIEFINYYGGKCLDCELSLEDTHYSVYDFHHRLDENKEFDWSKLRLMSKDKIHKELQKCDLLCANCHRLRHAGIRELSS